MEVDERLRWLETRISSSLRPRGEDLRVHGLMMRKKSLRRAIVRMVRRKMVLELRTLKSYGKHYSCLSHTHCSLSSSSGYDPAEFDHLQVSSEIKDMFKYITRYTPQTTPLDCKLAPFIPDFIPAIGDIDAFLKVT